MRRGNGRMGGGEMGGGEMGGGEMGGGEMGGGEMGGGEMGGGEMGRAGRGWRVEEEDGAEWTRLRLEVRRRIRRKKGRKCVKVGGLVIG